MQIFQEYFIEEALNFNVLKLENLIVIWWRIYFDNTKRKTKSTVYY